MLFFWILLIYFAVDWFLLNSINKRVIHTQNVTDIVYIVKLLKLFCCFLLFSTFQFFFNEYGVLSYFFFFCKNLFYLFIFLLYNIVLVLPCINMNPPQVYTCSPSWTSLPTPSLWVIPVHQPQASCILHRTTVSMPHASYHETETFEGQKPSLSFSYTFSIDRTVANRRFSLNIWQLCRWMNEWINGWVKAFIPRECAALCELATFLL